MKIPIGFQKLQVKVIIAGYRFSSDIVKTLPIYYFMLLEYMCEVSKLKKEEKKE